MVEITGQEAFTIHAAENEIYKVTYATNTAVDFYNDTGGDICINTTGEFSDASNVGNYFKLPDGASYNGFRPYVSGGTVFYIQTESAGDISITQKGW
ncbi:MAG: hypothetical protein ACI4A5_08975 [Hominilimicola sp.]